jgi:hypothetical protein
MPGGSRPRPSGSRDCVGGACYPSDGVTSGDVDGVTSEGGESVSTMPASQKKPPEGGAASAGGGDGHSWTGPLSITVAVGCTLLFFNILILGAVYYQRYHIRKLRLSGSRAGSGAFATDGSGHHAHNELDDPDDVKLSRKLEREANRNCVAGSVGGGGGEGGTGPETDSLLSASTGAAGSVVGVGGGGSGGCGNIVVGPAYLARAEESPGRELGAGGGGGGVSNSSTLGRRSPPSAVMSPVSSGGLTKKMGGGGGGSVGGGSLSRGPSSDSGGYVYTAVPTHSSSPLHRSSHPHPHYAHNSASSTLPHFHAQLPHHPQPGGVAMNTFGNSVGSLGRGPRFGGVSPRGGPGGGGLRGR